MFDICSYVCDCRVQTPPPPPGPGEKPSEHDPGPIVLPALKRYWAKGARLAFLEARVVGYKMALQQKRGRSLAAENMDTIVRDYFRTFHWSLPLDVDPAEGQVGVDPDGPPESLTIAEERMKAAVIVRMKTVRQFRLWKLVVYHLCRRDLLCSPFIIGSITVLTSWVIPSLLMRPIMGRSKKSSPKSTGPTPLSLS